MGFVPNKTKIFAKREAMFKWDIQGETASEWWSQSKKHSHPADENVDVLRWYCAAPEGATLTAHDLSVLKSFTNKLLSY